MTVSQPTFLSLQVESTCEPLTGCGRKFIATVLEGAGRTCLRQRHCPACSARLEEERQRQAAAEITQERRNQWKRRMETLAKYREPFDSQIAVEGSLELWQRAQRGVADNRPEQAAVEREAESVRRRLVEAMARVGSWQAGSKGIGLVGESGRAKTRLVFTLLERLFIAGMSVEFITATEFSDEVGSRFRDDPKSAKQWTDRLAQAAIFFYDDLGKENLTDRVVKELFNLFDKRAAARKPIFCTANFTGVQLQQRFDSQVAMSGAPIINRLRECCEFLPL